MRRQFLLASAGAIAVAGSAFAAEPLPAPPPPPPPIFSWTGLYLGGQIGYAWGRDRISDFFPPGPVVSFSTTPQGVIGGAHVGYNLQIGQWVVGVEGTVDGTSVKRTFFEPFNVVTFDTRSEVQGSIRGRLGVALDRALIYATGGAAFAGLENIYSAPLPFPPFFLTENVARTRSGWTVGGGLAYAVTNNWSVRAEYRYSDFGRFNDFPFAVLVPVGPFTQVVRHHLTQHQVQFGITYNFSTYAPPPIAAQY